MTKSFEGVESNELPDDFKITNDYNGQVFTLGNATGTNPYIWTLSGIEDDTTVTFTESGAKINGYNLEVKASGTVVTSATVSAKVVAGETVTAALVNTYTPKKVIVTLKKVDKNDVNKEDLQTSDLLDGAKFILEKYERLEPNEIKDAVWCEEHNALNAGNSGVFTFSNLETGVYKIVEKEYPAGYIAITSAPIFKIEPDLETGELIIALLDDAGGLVKLVDNELTIIVGNEPGAELPATGGQGTTNLYLLGIILTMFAAISLMMKRKSY